MGGGDDRVAIADSRPGPRVHIKREEAAHLLSCCGQIASAGQADLGALPALGDAGGHGRPVMLAHKARREDVRVAAGRDRGRGEFFPEPLAGAQGPRPEDLDREGVLRHGGIRRGREW